MISRILNSVFTATILLQLLAAVVYLIPYKLDLSALVCVDAKSIGRPPFEQIRTGFAKDGYDGQYYYVLAREPWRFHEPIPIDVPAFRHVRLFYPTLAWLLTFAGNPILLIWVMPAINLISISLLAKLGADFAVKHGRSPWWGALLLFVTNAGMPALRNLTDPLAMLSTVGLLMSYGRGRYGITLFLWAFMAAFTREQNLVILVILFLDSLRQRRWQAVLAVGSAGFAWLIWVIILRLGYGQWPMVSGNIDKPFLGLWWLCTHLEGNHGKPAVFNILGLSFIAIELIVSLIAFSRDRTIWTAGICLSGVVLAILCGIPVYASSWSYVRVLTWMPLGIWFWSIQSGRSWPIYAILPNAFWTFATVAQPWIEKS